MHSATVSHGHNTSEFTPEELAEMKIDPYSKSPKYAIGVVGFVCGFITLFVIARAILTLRRRFGPLALRSGIYRRVAAASRYLATKQQKVLGVRFPVLGVSLVIFAFFAFTMLWTWTTQPHYRSRWAVGAPPLAIRSGFLALGCVPFIFAFASKWNLVTFVTGHSHEKLQVYHQFMSHIFLILSLIHAIPFLVQGLSEVKPGFEPMKQLEYSYHVARKVYYWTGIALLVLLAWLCWASLSFIRKRYYETFKYLHVTASLLFTGFLFVHCNRRLGSWNYLYSTVIIYGASVVCRLGWVLYANSGGVPRAAFEVMPGGMVKLRVMANPLEKWKKGQHYFIHFMSVLPFQSHPFTIASIPHQEKDKPQELVVLIRQENGVTKKLGEYLAKRDAATTTIPVLLDGPFGGLGHDLSIYEHVQLFAGGTGITLVLPILQDLVASRTSLARTLRVNRFMLCGLFVTKVGLTCHILRVIGRKTDGIGFSESINWVISDLEEAARNATHTSVTIQLHVTNTSLQNPTSEGDSDSEIKEEEKDSLSDSAQSSSISYGRPDVTHILRNAGAECHDMGVAVCGPESLIYDVRNAVASIQRAIALGKSGCREVYLHTEEYAW